MHRIYLDCIFRKAQCVLHRRFLQHSRTDGRYQYSRTTCIEAALAILDIQRIVEDEIVPGGQLYPSRWKLSSLVNNDFLLATTILCVELHHHRTSPDRILNDPSTLPIETALTQSHRIWQRYCGASQEAKRATQALSLILDRHEPSATMPQTQVSSAELNDSVLSTPIPGYDPLLRTCPFSTLIIATALSSL